MTGPARFIFMGSLLVSASQIAVAEPLALHRPGLQLAQAGLAAPSSPSYGYQSYNDRNPTGFYHPNDMGYGSYALTPKYHGHRIPALSYRKFRGN